MAGIYLLIPTLVTIFLSPRGKSWCHRSNDDWNGPRKGEASGAFDIYKSRRLQLKRLRFWNQRQ